MIDPRNMTRYGQTQEELQETLIFSVMVAGHNAMSTAKSVDKLISLVGWPPFPSLLAHPDLEGALKACGFGCYNLRARTLREVAASGLDLSSCSAEELERFPGIGPKTSRFFLLHTRPGVRVAALDTHVLKYLRALGYDAPKTTPTGAKYRKLEEAFIGIADEAGVPIAELDLTVWNWYTKNSESRPA